MLARSCVVALFGVVVLGAMPTDARADDFSALLLKKADKLFGQRESGSKADEAKKAYLEVLAVDPKSVEARWKLSRVLYWIGRHAKTDDEKLKIFEEGIRYGQEAIEIDPKCYQCQFWVGVSYGQYGSAKGVLNSLGLVPHIQKAMKAVIDSGHQSYESGGPYRVLGRLDHKRPGNDDEAKKELEKAIQLGSDNLMNHRFYAELLLDMGDKDKAKAELELVIKAEPSSFPKGRGPEMRIEQKEAKAIWTKQGWTPIW